MDRMRLKRKLWNDVLEIPWSDIMITYEGEMMIFSPKIYVPIIGKSAVRELIADHDSKVQIILLRANNYVVLESSGNAVRPAVRPKAIQDRPVVSTLRERLSALEEGTSGKDSFRETLKNLAMLQPATLELDTPVTSRIKSAPPLTLETISNPYGTLASVLTETTRF